MTDRLRWGILGTGRISSKFAQALNNISEQGELLAVASRGETTGKVFGDIFQIPRIYEGYQALVTDPDVDVVYIGTPGIFHYRDMMMCLKSGKNVLCEKPFTINAKQAKDVIDLARKKNLFLMEAMWTRFFPIFIKIRKLLRDGYIGKANGLTVNFTGRFPIDEKNRFYDLNLGAGVLLDLGVYGISLAFNLFGKPEKVTGQSMIGHTGSDLISACQLKFPDGAIASIISSQISYENREATIFGTLGRIDIHDPWYKPTMMTIYRENHIPEVIEIPLENFNGYEYEALEVITCIQKGKLESTIISLDETYEIMKIMDNLRDQWGLIYPGE